MTLSKEILEHIAKGLRSASLDLCSKWACMHRVMGNPFPGPWSFKYHPWLKGMVDSEAELNVGRKAAQMGFTDAVLTRTFYMLDIKKVDCLYLLPSKTPDASDFSAARFEPAVEKSPHLQELFSEVRNVGLKQTKTGCNLYIRGTQSRTGLKSISTAFKVFDEVEEMVQEHIPLAMERSSGQRFQQDWFISTPSLADHGIDKMYNTTNQQHFMFRCPHCSRMTELIFPDCLIVMATDHMDETGLKQSQIICKECKHVLDHTAKHEWLSKAVWEPTVAGRAGQGFWINQLYSSAIAGQPITLARKVLKAAIDPTEEQELYNSTMGLPHEVKGARISEEQLTACLRNYRNGSTGYQGRIVTIGIDVGTFFHYEVDEYDVSTAEPGDLNLTSKCRLLEEGKVKTIGELEEVMHKHGIHFGVIDGNPERRVALSLASRWHGRVKLCFYSRGATGREIVENPNSPIISVDRTSWLDASLGRFKKKDGITIPYDTSLEYKTHLKVPVRQYLKDPDGNPVGKYLSGEKADHFAHARNYAEIALPLAMSIFSSADMENPQ